MGVELGEWLKTLAKYPVKYKFEGISGERRSDGFYETIGEAVTHDADFMDAHMQENADSHREILQRAIKERKNIDQYLSRYVEFIAGEVDACTWAHSFPKIKADRTWTNARVGTLLRIIEEFGSAHEGAFIDDLVGEPAWAWEWLRQPEEAEYLLKDHPIVEVYDSASGDGVPVGEVFVMCPGCAQQPMRLGDVEHCKMYCGLCGTEYLGEADENVLDFVDNMNRDVFPFDPDRAERWKEHFSGYLDDDTVDYTEWFKERMEKWKRGEFLRAEKPA